MGIVCFQLPEQIEQGAFLRISARIGGTAFFVESAFIADADALVVPTGGMGANLMDRTTNVYFTVTGDIEMITNIGKAPCQMAAAKRFHRKMTVTARSTAMNYQESYLTIDAGSQAKHSGQCSGHGNNHFKDNAPYRF